jgi:ribonuclease P protein component
VKSEAFTKHERIVSKKLIDQIFSGNGSHSQAAFPLRIVFMERTFTTEEGTTAQRPEEEPAVQVLVSVSKRHFKHAVDRNRVKRQVREAYRLNKQLITERVPADRQLCLTFIWLSDSLATSEVITARVKTLLKRIRLS